MFFLHQLGISWVYWINLFKMHCVLFTSRCTARRAKSYSIVYRILNWSTSETHLRHMCFSKLAHHTMCSSTAQDVHIGIEYNLFCKNKLPGSSVSRWRYSYSRTPQTRNIDKPGVKSYRANVVCPHGPPVKQTNKQTNQLSYSRNH